MTNVLHFRSNGFTRGGKDEKLTKGPTVYFPPGIEVSYCKAVTHSALVPTKHGMVRIFISTEL